MATEYTVVIDDAPCSLTAGRVIPLRLTDPDVSLRFNHGNWAARLPRALQPPEWDWLFAMEAAFAIDRACKRRPLTEPGGWTRRVRASLSLHDGPDWGFNAARLQEVFGDLTSDTLLLEVSPRTGAPRSLRQTKDEYEPLDAVALLSGGVDSFVGGAKLLQEGLRVLFLSHSAGSAVTQAQKRVQGVLSGLGDAQFSSFTMTPKRKSLHPFPPPSQTEPSERSRTLLFLGVAALIAKVCEVNDVYINENGIMAVHAPIAEARVGSYSTKTAAPSILEAVERLANQALDGGVRVGNALIKDTKADVVEKARALGVSDRLIDTVSCWAINRHGGIHCGICIPCIMRRLAFVSGDVDDADHQIDCLNPPQDLPDWAQDNLVHYLNYLSALRDLNDAELESRYGEVIEDSQDLSAEDSLLMHRRWASQCHEVIAAHPLSEWQES